MAVDVGYLSAVGAGAISFLSPCVLPLVPPYLCYMAGISVEQFRSGTVAVDDGRARRAVMFSVSSNRRGPPVQHGARRCCSTSSRLLGSSRSTSFNEPSREAEKEVRV